ncbi:MULTISPECIES: hypothetical protein [unclassified Pseudomonas]|uniref:hypothetical protein n=1 Tax=unclassified Pseudomonas TaxID=196821 RepID=UPI00111BDF10|nr:MULTISPECIES: hypothetical protein [unclassified Pseudomonas]
MAYTWKKDSIWHPFGCKCRFDPMLSGNMGCSGAGTWHSGPLDPTDYTERLEIEELLKTDPISAVDKYNLVLYGYSQEFVDSILDNMDGM